MASFNLVNPITSSIRQIFMVLDFFVYYFLQFNFELFFHIVTFNVVDREMIYNIVSRVQLVVGIFMMFQLVMIIIKGIVNPDSVTDSKSGGAGNIVMRIIVSLAMLALIVPINIPSPKNEYEKQINNNGILFGTLYSLQYRILSNNTIGKLILGSDASNYTSKEPDETDMHDFANRFTTTILRTFYPLNVDEDGNYICQDGWDEEYYNDDREPLWIISQGARKCGSSSALETAWDTTIYGEVGAMVTGKKYAVSMSYLTCTLVGLVIMALVFIMVFSVAKRVFQLAALQLLAPIPIISYMDPKGSKDGAFNSWLKLLGKTYLDLFIRIASMYFAIGVIQAFMDKYFGSVEAIATTIGTTASEAYQAWYSFANWWPLIFWEFIVIVIGLLLFAIEAPKFIKQMLGVKDDGKGFFSDFGLAMGLGVTAAGAIGSFASSRQASRDADFANTKERARQMFKNRHPNMDSDKIDALADRYAKMYSHVGNNAKNNMAGLFGAAMGIATGSAAASENKGNAWAKMMAATNAMNKRNQKVREAGRDGGTLFGALGSLSQEVFGGQSGYDALDAEFKKEEQKIKNADTKLSAEKDALKVLENNKTLFQGAKSRADDKTLKQKVTRAVIKDYKGVSGLTYNINGINAEEYNSQYSSAKSRGVMTFTIQDDIGNYHTIAMDDAEELKRQIDDGNSANYYDRAVVWEKVFDHSYRQEYANCINNGMNEAEATEEATRLAKIKAKKAGGIEDTTILAKRQAYREANNGENLPDTYENRERVVHDANGNIVLNPDGSQKIEVVKGLKVLLGDVSNAIEAKSNEITREQEEISKRKQDLNDRKQGDEARRLQQNRDRFKNG